MSSWTSCALPFGAILLLAACGSKGGSTSDGSVADGDADINSAVDASSLGAEEWAPLAWEDCEGSGRTLEASPDNYRTVMDTLMPGDTMQLQAGMYERGLPIRFSGTAGNCIVIEGAPGGGRPMILGSNAFNLIEFRESSWVKVRGIDLDGLGLGGFAVASQGGDSGWAHHIVVEDLHMVGFGGNQQIVGVSTKTPAWDWVIRGNTIIGAGTGLYLGNSNGASPFIRGLIEYNLVLDTLGYNMQIKHQRERPTVMGMPTEQSETTIRYNVFSKENGASGGGNARPNFLLGHLPTTGVGASDRYLVYGNFFHENPSENLVQAEGNVAFYSNVLVNSSGGAVLVQPHNDVPKQIDVFMNTVFSTGRPIRVSGGDPAFTQRVFYNAVFSDMGISAADATENVEASQAEAGTMLVNATAEPGLDLHPNTGELMGTVELDSLSSFPNAARDFDRRTRSGNHYGAYAGPATATSWPLGRERRSTGL